ncbi:uncharacterized protein [Typha latifolia]|uniref:uncharacterized protein isoform X2 n=1 Tax=Typha latifolia TaxID=4733 RepID=UPI003C301308
MPPLHACKLDLLPSSSSSSSSAAALIVSLLCEPSSRSLALFLSDSSVLLFSSLSPFSSSPPQSPTRIPSSASSAAAACFARLLPSPSNAAHVVFLSATSSPAAVVLLRAWVLPPLSGRFAPATISFKRRTHSRAGLALDALPHGLGVRLAGSVNVVALHSLAANQIWILAVKLTEKEGEGTVLELKKCAVVEVLLPIYSIAVDMGCLILGEVGGVRVFPLRPLIKGRPVKRDTRCRGTGLVGDVCKKKDVLNGLVAPPSRGKSGGCSVGSGKASATGENCCCNEVIRLEGVVEGNADKDIAPRKLRTVRVQQNSGDHCSFFIAMSCDKEENLKNGMGVLTLVKAVSIHTLSKNKFMVLDSAGDLHILSLHSTIMTSETTGGYSITPKGAHTHHLDHVMKVQLLAVLPDISMKKQVIWASDGGHSIHMIAASDIEPPVSEDGEDDKRSTMIQISDTEAIFVKEKVQDIVALSKNAVLVLGQGKEIYLHMVLHEGYRSLQTYLMGF